MEGIEKRLQLAIDKKLGSSTKRTGNLFVVTLDEQSVEKLFEEIRYRISETIEEHVINVDTPVQRKITFHKLIYQGNDLIIYTGNTKNTIALVSSFTDF